MRTIKLNGDEVKSLYDALNQGDPQRGMTITEIRDIMPIMDKLEVNAKKTNMPTPNGVRQVLQFQETDLGLKESEYTLAVDKLEGSSGWVSVEIGRGVVKLIDKLKEVPSTPDPEDKTD